MNTAERNRLSKEAEMQLAALKRISHWKTIALAISTIGVAGAVVFNLGLKNGRRNVEKILNILDKGRVL